MPMPKKDDFRGTPFADLPVDVGEPWNPNGAPDSELIAACLGPGGDNWEAFKKAHLAYAPGEDFGGDPPTQQDAYKLKVARRYPATDPKGTLKVNFQQLSSRIAILNGAREGADLTEEARRQAYAHAVKYYKKIDREPPELKSAMPNGAIERRAFDLDEIAIVRSDDGKPPSIRGHAAVFNLLSEPLRGGSFRERIRPGAFTKTLAEADIRSLWNHNPDYVLGRTKSNTLRIWEDSVGLGFSVEPPDTQWARDLMVSIERRDIDQASFGFRTVRDDMQTLDGQTVRELIEVQLFDVSPVTFPAYPQTDVKVRSMLADLGIDWEAVAAVLARSQQDIELTATDIDIIRCSIELLSRHLPAAPDATVHPVGSASTAARPLAMLRRDLESAEKSLI